MNESQPPVDFRSGPEPSAPSADIWLKATVAALALCAAALAGHVLIPCRCEAPAVAEPALQALPPEAPLAQAQDPRPAPPGAQPPQPFQDRAPQPGPNPAPSPAPNPASVPEPLPAPARAPGLETGVASPTPAAAQEAFTGAFVVAVGSYADAANARAVLAQIQGQQLPGTISAVQASGKTLHRVRSGPYASEAEAQRAAQRLRATGLDAVVAKQPG